tara:strand:+ start:791 stop:958 length:168 start_codon:yes stop_codon:yes gene_type:complete
MTDKINREELATESIAILKSMTQEQLKRVVQQLKKEDDKHLQEFADVVEKVYIKR